VELLTYPDAEVMMLALADRLASELRQALDGQGRVSLAVPGGTTPGPIFDALSAARLDWQRVDLMLTDERWVPESSDRSNTRLLRQRLCVGPAAAAHLAPFYRDDLTAEQALPDLSAAIAPMMPLSVCLLGMGADMHTASIFPGADRLSDALTTTNPLVPMRAPGAAEPRLTLSAHVLRGAMRRHIVIIGPEKRDALDRARHLPPEQAPVAAILPGTTVHWAPA
jgi:6-phosphogluconolactonase